MRRMLLAAEAHIRESPGSSSTRAENAARQEYAQSIAFQQHVKALSELVETLPEDGGERARGALEVEALLAEAERVGGEGSGAGTTEEAMLPAYCRIKKTSLGARARPRRPTDPAARPAPAPAPAPSSVVRLGDASTLRARARARGPGPGSGETGGDQDSAVLRQHAAAHEALTSDLAELSSRLKHRMEDVSAAVAARDARLDTAHEAAASSLNATKTAVSRSASLYRSGWRTGCVQWILLLIVAGVFAGMFVFIRMTSLVGLKPS